MSTTTLPDPGSNVGIAAHATEDFVQAPVLFSGEGRINTTNEPIGQNTTIVYGQVVGRSSGKIVPAVLGTTEAIGVALVAITTGAGGSGTIAVARSGTLNPDAAVWDATYDTAEKKRLAFEATATPIYVKAPKTA